MIIFYITSLTPFLFHLSHWIILNADAGRWHRAIDSKRYLFLVIKRMPWAPPPRCKFNAVHISNLWNYMQSLWNYMQFFWFRHWQSGLTPFSTLRLPLLCFTFFYKHWNNLSLQILLNKDGKWLHNYCIKLISPPLSSSQYYVVPVIC